MASIKPLSRGERRDIRCSPGSGLTPAERAFAEVSIEWFAGAPLLQLVFGELYFEMPDHLARDFADRIARAMRTRIRKGSRRGFRCGSGLTPEERRYVEVLMHDDFERTWLRLEFDDGNVVDFSTRIGPDFAARVARAVKALPTQERVAA